MGGRFWRDPRNPPRRRRRTRRSLYASTLRPGPAQSTSFSPVPLLGGRTLPFFSSTTSTSCHSRSAFASCTAFWRGSCGSTVASRSTGARLRFGIVAVSSLQVTMPSSQPFIRMTPDAQIWFGDHGAPASERGIRVLGTPLGSEAFVRAQLQAIGESHELLLSRIPAIQDLQSTWLLLLFCAATRATYFLRVCHPTHSVQFAHQHDVSVWQCLCSLLGQPLNTDVWEVGSLPYHLGGLGLRSVSCTIHAACWGRWADCLSSIRQRHAQIAQTMVGSPRFAPGDSHPFGRCSIQPCHVGSRRVRESVLASAPPRLAPSTAGV